MSIYIKIEEFRDTVYDKLREELKGYTVEKVGSSQISVKFGEEESSGMLNLERLYSEARQYDMSVEDIEQLADNLVSTIKGAHKFTETQLEWEEVKEHLRMLPKNIGFIKDNEKEGVEFIYINPCIDAACCVVVDYPDSMRYLLKRDIPHLGVSEEEIINQAILHTDKNPDARITGVNDDIYLITGDNLAPLIYDKQRLRSLFDESGLKGENMLVTFNDRNCFNCSVVKDSSSFDATILEVIKAFPAANPVSQNPIILDKHGDWHNISVFKTEEGYVAMGIGKN